MTEQIKKTIKILKDAKIGIERWDMTEWYDTAIRSLSAWEEVLNELEILIRGCDIMLEDNNEDMFYGGKKRGYEKVIEVINQKLAEIEE